jgi:uncharacterized protein YndB with AHSA1/START domain
VADLDVIHVDQFLPHSPARVWRALIDPERLSRWLMPNDFAPVVGHRFTFQAQPMPAVNFAGVIHCEVLVIEPERLLQISWVDRSGSGLDSTVTWRLEPEGHGTRLMLEHAGFNPRDPIQQMARRAMGGGWRLNVMRVLLAVLAEDG